MKIFMNMLVVALAAFVALPSYAASTPNSTSDCKKKYAGDKVKIQSCIDHLQKKADDSHMKADDLHKKADDLQKKADALKMKADDLGM